MNLFPVYLGIVKLNQNNMKAINFNTDKLQHIQPIDLMDAIRIASDRYDDVFMYSFEYKEDYSNALMITVLVNFQSFVADEYVKRTVKIYRAKDFSCKNITIV